jgi:hypothetical protein
VSQYTFKWLSCNRTYASAIQCLSGSSIHMLHQLPCDHTTGRLCTDLAPRCARLLLLLSYHLQTRTSSRSPSLRRSLQSCASS